MGPPTKAAFVKMWITGQNEQQSANLYGQPLNSSESIAALPPGDPEALEALPPGAQLQKSIKEEQAREARCYARLNLTKDEVTGDEESKKKV